MKTTIYDLLGMIKDNKAPKKIYYNYDTYVYDKVAKDYKDINSCSYISEYMLNDGMGKFLNKEVEILGTTITLQTNAKEMCHNCEKYPAEYNQTYCEFCLGITPKKIEKLDVWEFSGNDLIFAVKINEIIDYLMEE